MHASTNIRASHTLSKAVFAAAALTLAAAALSGTADARVKGPRLDSLSAGCGILQDEADRLRAEYANQNTSNARREEILTRLRQIGRDWNNIGCRAVFGDISIRVKPVITVRGDTAAPLGQKTLNQN